MVGGPAHVKMPANAGLCGAVGRSTLLASRLLILRLTSRNPHGIGTSSPSASVSAAAAPLAREGEGGVTYGNGLVRRARERACFAQKPIVATKMARHYILCLEAVRRHRSC